MIKKTLVLFSAIALLCCGVFAEANAQKKGAKSSPKQNVITLKGNVKFNDPNFKMSVYQRQGFDKKVIGEFDINPDGSYEYKMTVDEPGVYTLDCKKWQSVEFWAENENLNIDFRGLDTAKMKIKNPPFVFINGGPLNEVMNLLNFVSYRNYQLMIGLSQLSYRTKLSDDDKGQFAGGMYDLLNTDVKARLRYIAETYSDRNSALAALTMMHPEKDADVINKVVSRLEKINPNYAPLVKYKQGVADAKSQRDRLAIGQPAPEFSFPTPDGTKNISIKDYKGKLLVIDFWASWCGPCRLEIPHVKEVYAKYKDQGVDILSVSIDKKDEDWKKALKEEGMPWAQVCAPGAGKDLMKQYQFSGIPYIILVSKDGKILAKGLRGKAIDAAIDEALKAK